MPIKDNMRKWFPVLFPKRYRSKSDDLVDWKALEKKLLHTINNRDIFREALRHRSHPSCSYPSLKLSNERLEFLGDALLNFYVGDFLYKTFPDAHEGNLTKMRSILVSRKFLAKKGKQLNIGEFITLGEGEQRSGGKYKDSILSNAIESIIGALHLDGGQDAVWNFIRKVIIADYETTLQSEGHNYKGDLLEYVQKKHLPALDFVTKKETGPDHKKTYIVAVQMGKEVLGIGRGKNKKTAEQEAAHFALSKIMR